MFTNNFNQSEKSADFCPARPARRSRRSRNDAMDRRRREITVYVRNKQRYDPSSKLYDFLHVTVRNFARTTIGEIKEVSLKGCKKLSSIEVTGMFVNKHTWPWVFTRRGGRSVYPGTNTLTGYEGPSYFR